MKRILFLLVPFMMLSCEEEYFGEIDISGYCFDPCSGSPLANYQVHYSNRETYFETYTDAKGYFKLKESYSYRYKPGKLPSPGDYFFRDTANRDYKCNTFGFFEDYDFENDTIYFFRTLYSVFTVKIDPNFSTTILDTLFMTFNEEECGDPPRPKYRSSGTYYSVDYNKFYVGPFSNNQILDTIKTWVAPHVGHSVEGYATSSYIFRGPSVKYSYNRASYFPPVNGQSDIACDNFIIAEINLNQ